MACLQVLICKLGVVGSSVLPHDMRVCQASVTVNVCFQGQYLYLKVTSVADDVSVSEYP
jgi:hypothetical protein